ncbi:MAG: thiol peroxidase [Tissierellia bacterium]|nr:thiol peroxidase [Tissierellia bacterium]
MEYNYAGKKTVLRKDAKKFQGNPISLIGEEIKVGDKAIDFTAQKVDLSEFKLSDTSGKIRLISVVPSIDTGVCQIQTRTFNEEATKLSEDVILLTISVDLPFAQERFCAAEGLDRVVMLSDHIDTDFGIKYGFLIDGLRLLNRGIVVIDRDDIVKYVEYVEENTDEADYEKALDAVKALI